MVANDDRCRFRRAMQALQNLPPDPAAPTLLKGFHQSAQLRQMRPFFIGNP
jgi:hypothetical protein